MTVKLQSRISTEQFLNEIHGPDAQIYFNTNGKTWKYKPQTYLQAKKTLSWLNKDKNKDIYFIVNSGGSRDCQINQINAVFIDWDAGKDTDKNYLNLDIVKEKKDRFLDSFIEISPLDPSFIIETRNGYQIYWLLYPGTTNSQFVDIQKRLSCYFNSDKSVYNPARCMRLPGYNWVKAHKNCAPFYVDIIKYNDVRYSCSYILNSFPAVPCCSSTSVSKKVKAVRLEKRTHNNTSIKGTSSIIVGPKTPKEGNNIKFTNMNEIVEYLKTRNLTEYMGLNNSTLSPEGSITVNCPFHNDSNPSASIFKEAGIYLMKCHSNNCSFETGSIIDMAAKLNNIDETKAIKLLMDHYNIEIDQSWIEREKEILKENIEIINNLEEYKDIYPDLYRCIWRIRRDLISKLEFAGDNIKLQTSDGKSVFFCSLRHFEKISKSSYLLNVGHNGQNIKVDRYCLLGLMKKVSEDELPKSLWSNTEEVRNKRGLKYRIQYFSIPEYSEDVLKEADSIASELKKYGIRMNAISKDAVLQIFGKDKSAEVYPQIESDHLSESGREFMEQVGSVLLSDIESKGYSKIKDIVSKMLEYNDWKSITDRRVKKYIPGLLIKHGLLEVRSNKLLKESLGIISDGYPSVIVRKGTG